jgi:LysM repeat protein
VSDWLPGAIVVSTSNDGGSMLGGGAFCTWHSFEADPRKLSAKRGAEVLVAAGNGGTFCVNPLSGDIAQMVPASRASRMLCNLSGGVQTNRMGDVHIQIEVIAYANNPFTNYWSPEGKAAIQKIAAFARAHGVPDVWPAGQPPAYPGPGVQRTAPTSGSGHYAHSQWKENDHGDPGLIDYKAILGSTPTPPPAGTYVVKSGDTLSGIGFRLGMSWQVLASVNNLKAPYTIYPGQILNVGVAPIPSPALAPTPTPQSPSAKPTISISQVKPSWRNEDIRRYQLAARAYVGPDAARQYNPNGATGYYGLETKALTSCVYRVLSRVDHNNSWLKGDLTAIGPKGLARVCENTGYTAIP